LSKRHREGREVDEAILHKKDRLEEHRRKRRVARQALHCEGEEAVLAQGHDHLHAHRSEKPVDPEKPARRNRRHWKLPYWKRRMAERHEKAAAFRRIAEEA
jgi:hypothetical protein